MEWRIELLLDVTVPADNIDQAKLLVIGYGNALRRDDGAGPHLAARLAARWQESGFPVELVCLHQLLPELAEELANPDTCGVLFVDCEFRLPPDHATTRLSRLDDTPGSQPLGHNLTPQTLLLYATKLYGVAPPAWMLAVPAADLGFGETFSATTAHAIAQTMANAENLWQEIAPFLFLSAPRM